MCRVVVKPCNAIPQVESCTHAGLHLGLTESLLLCRVETSLCREHVNKLLMMGFLRCCTASKKQVADRPEAATIDELISATIENCLSLFTGTKEQTGLLYDALFTVIVKQLGAHARNETSDLILMKFCRVVDVRDATIGVNFG